ncbi:hypothetical protein V757_06765 [Pelistega indica]|uniref:4'-phosphopantetheinyl transferase domain-containing protein n=1 Tax=Pelistega indica TaxID=1414851 RepID=V8G3S4_9BURK|nr:4'-phosphopantetheinyl transferase superfamily protein [Pelistega indica]ETD71179.1 hypothetical protein V757_06765 [Pelistega indica]
MVEKYLKQYVNAPAYADIWYCSLKNDVIDELADECISFLSAKDLNSIAMYRIPSLARRMIVTRGLTRKILSFYVDGIPSDRICLYTTSYGKPYLEPSLNVYFSLSHCSNVLVVAVSRKFEVGIDIENIYGQSHQNIVPFVLSENELEIYIGTDDNHKESVFLTFWTRKEAYVKCLGIGLTDNLNRIDTSDFLSKQIVFQGKYFECFSIDVPEMNCISHLVINANST